MRYAIVESGGKQYKAVEGEAIEVDRLPAATGAQIDLERVMLFADGDEITVGTPTLDGIKVKATVLDHFLGRKIVVFRYSPKKRIRVKRGHRQQYTRLMVDFIGRPGEVRKAARKVEEPEAPVPEKPGKAVEAPKTEKTEKVAKAPKATKAGKPGKPARAEKMPKAKQPARAGKAAGSKKAEKTPTSPSVKAKKTSTTKPSPKGKAQPSKSSKTKKK